MKLEDIEIMVDEPDRAYRTICALEATVRSPSALSRARTAEEVNSKIREQALKAGATAVIRVTYRRGMSAISWKTLTATGTAVRIAPSEKVCPACAETVKAAAVVCRYCSAALPPAPDDWDKSETELEDSKLDDRQKWLRSSLGYLGSQGGGNHPEVSG